MLNDRQRLDEARVAYHQLMTGTKPSVIVDQNGERVEFVKANVSQLASYIRELEKRLGVCGTAIGTSGPARFVF